MLEQASSKTATCGHAELSHILLSPVGIAPHIDELGNLSLQVVEEPPHIDILKWGVWWSSSNVVCTIDTKLWQRCRGMLKLKMC